MCLQDNVSLNELLQNNCSDPNAEPVLEIITSFYAIEPKGIDVTERPRDILHSVISKGCEDILMIIHSAIVSQIISD